MPSSGQTGIYRLQHAGKETTMVVDTSSVLRGDGTFDFASGRVTMPGALGRAYIPLNLLNAQAKTTATASGLVPLTTGTNPQRHSQDVTGGPTRIRWTSAAGATNQLFFEPVGVPNDLSSAGGLRLHLTGEGASANATNELGIRFFAGAATASGGFTTLAMTSAVGERSATIASGSVPATGFITIGLSPNAHASGTIDLYGARLSYQRLTS